MIGKQMSKADLIRALIGGGEAAEPEEHDHELPMLERIEAYAYHEKLEAGDMLAWIQQLEALRDAYQELEGKLRLNRAEGLALHERIQYETRKRYEGIVSGQCTSVGIRKHQGTWYVVGHVFHKDAAGGGEKKADGSARQPGGIFL